ncbi:MAG: ROK family protein [Candidatus Doudnabacteria bacterium]|nr:ROK family protein [bacterium]MDZ4244113.1 ROK family protein [Candidatus Doudnabacteria bacterium]
MRKAYIGLDIGGTKIEAVLARANRVLRSEEVRTPRNKQAFAKGLFRLVEKVSHGEKFHGIGLSCAGWIDRKEGIILSSPNIKFLHGMELVKIIREKFRVHAALENDANCFLRGEHAFGAARGKKNVVAFTLGTGVGGAIMIENKLLHGTRASAGELGHMTIAYPASVGTVESLASSHFFEKFKLGGALDIQRAAEAGNKKAKAIYAAMGRYLGVAMANVVNIFDPELIILGGGISRGYKLFLPSALAEMKKHTLSSLRFLPPVRVSKLKHAGALGATTLL